MPCCHSCFAHWRKMEAADFAQSESATVAFQRIAKDLDGISQKVLTDSLRQMVDDGLVYRRDYRENPPRVEYGLTELGRRMFPIIDALAVFGDYYKSVVK